ncbi:MAG TPA: Rieske 2Fe-2S domain-containing protein [Thermomicrobiales bacterium]|nr:Rieske 2Fe-2S domain-containing protein [Thermomicrobiales bacterium]
MLPLVRTIFGLTIGWLFTRLLWVLTRLNLAHSPETRRVTRRSFVRNATLGAVLLNLGLLGAGFVRFFYPNKTGAFGGDIDVLASNVPAVEGEPYKDTEGKFYIVHTKDGVLALYWKCVHLGCTVPWIPAEKRFHCPCHGSIYLYDGTRIAGPAPRSLDIFQVTAKSTGDLVVNTGKITERAKYEPNQATPYPA